MCGTFPQAGDDLPDLVVGYIRGPGRPRVGYNFQAGEIAFAGGRLYLPLLNANKIVGYNGLPTSAGDMPDFAVGSRSVAADAFRENFILRNPVPATNGTSLLATSDIDSRLYVWKRLPDTDGARPDVVYRFPETPDQYHVSPWDNAVYGTTFAMAGKDRVYVWTSLPAGQMPNRSFVGNIGTTQLWGVGGVAIDATRFYVADTAANRVYVWNGIPTAMSSPDLTLEVPRPERLFSDGSQLLVTSASEGTVSAYDLATLAADSAPVVIHGPAGDTFAAPGDATVADGKLYAADSFNPSACCVFRPSNSLPVVVPGYAPALQGPVPERHTWAFEPGRASPLS